MISFFKRIGPGLLFAGAAIGVSHLVQSTRAGADYGLGLLWALILINIIKYPFFEYGPRYASATGESLLDGYKRLGKVYLQLYFILSLATMFTIQTAVTIVTAGIANAIFGEVNFLGLLYLGLSATEIWTVVILVISFFILLIGRYTLLDKLIKLVIILLALSTLMAVVAASYQFEGVYDLKQFWPAESKDLVFLIAFMGWMPAPIDVSVFHSLWAEQKMRSEQDFRQNAARFDFNVGYLGTISVGVLFMLLGFYVMFPSGTTFDTSATGFANQLISLYTRALGSWAEILIALAALTAMFSTTITTLDASPRAMSRSVELIFGSKSKMNYIAWLVLLTLGTMMVFILLASEMALLIKIATVLSFLTAPFYAALNFKLVCSTHTPSKDRPPKWLKMWSWLGLLFLICFSVWYLISMA
jgi:Mn2+/Fe2+ NRAMP family transporter